VKQTLTDALFNMDAELFPFADIMRARSVLRKAVTSARPQLYYCRTEQSTATLLNRVVTRDLHIDFRSHRSDDDFSLTAVLNGRSASCLGTALVNLAIAEPLHISVYAVLYNRHIGLRFVGENERYDVEPCCGNYPLSTPSKQSRGFAADGVPLTTTQLIAFTRVNRATTRYAGCGEKEKALKELDAAIAFFPEYAADWLNRPGPDEKGRM